MGIPASQLRRGQVLEFENDLWIIVELEHVKLSKGGGAMQAKLKNLKRGDHINHRFRSSDKVETAFLDKTICEYLYPEGESFVFMDIEDYEQYILNKNFVGDQMPYVKHNSRVTVTFYEDNPISVDLPSAVELAVTDTEPGFKGDSVSNTFKPATLETGLEVKVPNHIGVNDVVKISTETGEFLNLGNFLRKHNRIVDAAVLLHASATILAAWTTLTELKTSFAWVSHDSGHGYSYLGTLDH